jgi:hypothetical protein
MPTILATEGKARAAWTGGSSHTGTTDFGGATLTRANAFITMVVSNVAPTTTAVSVTSITDTEGNTWRRLTSINRNSWQTSALAGGQVAAGLEVWWTIAASSGPSLTFTITFDGTIDAGVWVTSAKLLGVNAAQPFDQHTNATVLVYQNSSTATAPTFTGPSGISTSSANVFPMVAITGVGFGQQQSSWTFDGVSAGVAESFAVGTNACVGDLCDLISFSSSHPTVPYSSATFVGAATLKNCLLIAFNVTPDASTPSGTWASTETKDTFAATGYPGGFGITGDLTSTEARDIFAAVGYPNNVGVWTTLEAPDRFSAFGFQPQTAVWHSTEAADVFHGTGIGLGENGVWASTEATDIFAATGFTPVSGTFIVTEAADRFQAFGAGVIRVRRRRTSFVT